MMAQNLRARLQRIREAAPAIIEQVSPVSVTAGPGLPPGFSPVEWEAAAFQTIRRSIYLDCSRPLPHPFPRSLGILIPDMIRHRPPPVFPPSPEGPVYHRPEDLLFFDLETTGLSGGAGTAAFLAAFGRFIPPSMDGGKIRLRVDQYLLLDYPGESAFLEAVLHELGQAGSSGPLLVTYNGKAFDTPLLAVRCLMNGIRPPAFAQADLLHPSRRLWKRILPSCSQGIVETSILGLDRTGDMPGAMAPEMWFSFLRAGETAGLLEVCDHNRRDILGLAHLFALLVHLAAEPLDAAETIPLDLENLALFWRRSIRRAGGFFGEQEAAEGRALLDAAARRGCPQALYAAAQDAMSRGDYDEGRRRFRELAVSANAEAPRAAACQALAIDAEWRSGDIRAALDYTAAALAMAGLSPALGRELFRRQRRLLEKMARALS